MSSDLDRRAADETPPVGRAIGNHLMWPVLIAVGLIVYELTAEPGLGAAIACTKFGWDDLLTARWLRRTDPNRPRARAMFWLFVAAGLWKMALTGVCVMVAVTFAIVWLKHVQPGMPPVFAAGTLAMLFGFALSALATVRALIGARINRVRLWLDGRVHFDRERRRWPPRLDPPGRKNRAGAVVLTTVFVSLLVIIGFGIALAKNILRAWVVGLGGQPRAADGPIALALLVMLAFVPVVLILTRDLLDNLVLARTPAECWDDV